MQSSRRRSSVGTVMVLGRCSFLGLAGLRETSVERSSDSPSRVGEGVLPSLNLCLSRWKRLDRSVFAAISRTLRSSASVVVLLVSPCSSSSSAWAADDEVDRHGKRVLQGMVERRVQTKSGDS